MSEEGKKDDKISEVEVKEEQSQPQQALEIEENAYKIEQKQPEQSKESLDQRSEKIEQKDIQTQKQAINTEQQEHQQYKAADIKTLHEEKQTEDVSSELQYIVPPTPEQLLRAEDESRQKQKLINQILRMYDDFERLQIRSEQLKQQNHYFIDKINEFEQIIFEDDSTLP